jgi:hypothetical protein
MEFYKLRPSIVVYGAGIRRELRFAGYIVGYALRPGDDSSIPVPATLYSPGGYPLLRLPNVALVDPC